MIAIDTNILARFYIKEPEAKRSKKTEAETAIAAKIMKSGRALWVPKPYCCNWNGFAGEFTNWMKPPSRP